MARQGVQGVGGFDPPRPVAPWGREVVCVGLREKKRMRADKEHVLYINQQTRLWRSSPQPVDAVSGQHVDEVHAPQRAVVRAVAPAWRLFWIFRILRRRDTVGKPNSPAQLLAKSLGARASITRQNDFSPPGVVYTSI